MKPIYMAILLVAALASCRKEKPVEPKTETPPIDTVLIADTLGGTWEVTALVINYYEEDTLKGTWEGYRGDGISINGSRLTNWSFSAHSTWMDLTKDGHFVHYGSQYQPNGYMLKDLIPVEGQWQFMDAHRIKLSVEVWDGAAYTSKLVEWTVSYQYPELILKTEIPYTMDGVKSLDHIQMKLEKQYY